MKMEHGDDDPRCALMKAHVRVHLWHVALMKEMEYVDDDLSYSLRMVHAPWHYDVCALPKWRKSVDDDSHDVQGHSWCGADLTLRSHSMSVLPSRWGT